MARAAKSTQSFVRIDQIRDDVILLKGGGMRAVLQCSSINLALKEQSEQDAIIYGFQDFLNSLDFSVQIVISSRFLNIDDYIAMLQQAEKQQKNDLLSIQTIEYINFIKDFVETTNIITTDFYIVIPFELSEALGKRGVAGGPGGILSMFGFGKKPAGMERAQFLRFKNQLRQRIEFVKTGLHRFGVVTKLITTEELIMLFWNLYNPQNLQKRTLVKSIFEKY